MTWLRLRRLHHINLRRPHAGKVIFYVCLSGCDKPRLIIHPLQQVRWGGKNTVTSRTSLFFPLLSVFIPCFFFCFVFCPPCHKLTPVSTHCSRTPILFSPFLLFFVFLLWRRLYHFPAGRPLLSNCDEWLWLLYRFPNWNNLGTKQVAVYHIDFLNWV